MCSTPTHPPTRSEGVSELSPADHWPARKCDVQARHVIFYRSPSIPFFAYVERQTFALLAVIRTTPSAERRAKRPRGSTVRVSNANGFSERLSRGFISYGSH
jgi:hypothetical protein